MTRENSLLSNLFVQFGLVFVSFSKKKKHHAQQVAMTNIWRERKDFSYHSEDLFLCMFDIPKKSFKFAVREKNNKTRNEKRRVRRESKQAKTYDFYLHPRRLAVLSSIFFFPFA